MPPFPPHLKTFLSITPWTHAKTMPEWPHEYIVRKNVDERLFVETVNHIREFGYQGSFYKMPITYFDEDGLVYWAMGSPVEETIIINRCKKENSYEERLKNGNLRFKIHEMQSLLGQFYSRIKGSQEDIASEGLTYILQRSRSARLAICKIVKSDCGLDFDDLSFTTQNIGDKLERPDISGHNNERKEVLILEAKFWASLTENQPIEYLNRLEKNSVLMFIVPTLRVRPIFDELLKRVKSMQIAFTPNPTSHSLTFIDSNKHLVVKTWNEILGAIRLHLAQDNEQVLLSDIDQIIGLCDTIDSNSFMPIQADDLSPRYAKRINSYYDLVDKVVDELRKREIANTQDTRSAAQKFSYTRWFKTAGFGVSINVNFKFWAEIADTPFWVNFKDNTSDKVWSMSEELKRKCKIVASQHSYKIHETNSREMFFAIFPPIDKTEDVVINEIAEHIIKITVYLDIDTVSNHF